MSSHSRRLSMLFCLTSASLLLACSGAGGNQAASGPGAKQDSEAPLCIKEAPQPPELESLGPRELPSSELWLQARVPTRGLLQQVQEQLPQPLAQAKNLPVGAPGKATYEVTHGAPRLKNTKQGLELRIPIQADISVCKPFGRSCFRYGSCKPAFEARVTIENQWDESYHLAAPRARIHATKKCVIGMDVTPQIEKIARAETAKVERQISRQWPRTESYARAAWSELSRAIPVAKTGCVHLIPSSLHYSPLRVEQKGKTQWLTGGFGIKGEFSPAETCQSRQLVPALPPTQIESEPDESSRLWVPQAIPLHELEAELRGGVNGNWGKTPENNVLVKEVRFGGNQVAILVESTGEVCGFIWLWGSLAYENQGHQIYMELEGHTDFSTREELAAPLLNHLKTKSRFKLKSLAPFNPARAEAAIEHFTDKLPPEIQLKVSQLQLPKTEVRLDQEGVLLLHEVKAKLEIKAVKFTP